jgi:hypothetical protein
MEIIQSECQFETDTVNNKELILFHHDMKKCPFLGVRYRQNFSEKHYF